MNEQTDWSEEEIAKRYKLNQVLMEEQDSVIVQLEEKDLDKAEYEKLANEHIQQNNREHPVV